jgi:biotin carboxylase
LELHRKSPYSGVVTFSEPLLRSTAFFAKKARLRFHTPHQVELLQDKFLQRKALALVGISEPRFALLRTPYDIRGALEQVSLPAVLKPRFGFGSITTYRIDSTQQLYELFTRAVAIRRADYRFTELPADFVLEELLVGERQHSCTPFGDYVSVESLISNGRIFHLAIADKFALAEPFRETGEVMPSTRPAETQNRILYTATHALRGLGVRTGATHTEIKLTRSGPKIIEVNGRLGGGVADLMNCLGYNAIEQCLAVASGAKRPDPFPHGNGFASWVHPHTDINATSINGFVGVDEIQRLPGVVMARELLPADSDCDWESGSSMLFGAVLHRQSLEELLSLRDAVISNVNAEYEGVLS